MKVRHSPPKPGFKRIYRPWVTDPKTGRRKYPRKARVFVIDIPENEY